MKKLLALTLALAVCAGLAVPAFADRLLKPDGEAINREEDTAPAAVVYLPEPEVLLHASLWRGEEETAADITGEEVRRQAAGLLRTASPLPVGITPPSSISGVNLYLDFPEQARLHVFTSAVRGEGFDADKSYTVIRHMDRYYTAGGEVMGQLTELLFPDAAALWAALRDPASPESAAKRYHDFLLPRLSPTQYGGLEFTGDHRGLVLWQIPGGGVTPALVAQLTTAYEGEPCEVTYQHGGRSVYELDEVVSLLNSRRTLKGEDTLAGWNIDRANGVVVLRLSARWPELNAAMREKGYTERVRFLLDAPEG